MGEREGRHGQDQPARQDQSQGPKEPHRSSTVMKDMPPNAGAERGSVPRLGIPYLMPGVRCGGCSARSLCTCSLEGWIRAKRCVRAALKGTAPPMACRVLEGGRPNNQASQVSCCQSLHAHPPQLLSRSIHKDGAPPYNRCATLPWE